MSKGFLVMMAIIIFFQIDSSQSIFLLRLHYSKGVIDATALCSENK